MRALLYLPPYSPELNPIEEAFAKLKALLRKAGAPTREALIEAMGRALEAVTARDACGFFEHQSLGIYQQVALSPFDLLGGVEAALLASHAGGPDRL